MVQKNRNNEDNLVIRTRPTRVKERRKLKRKLPSHNKHLKMNKRNLPAEGVDVDGEESPKERDKKAKSLTPNNLRRLKATTDNRTLTSLQEERDAVVETEINREVKEDHKRNRESHVNLVNQENPTIEEVTEEKAVIEEKVDPLEKKMLIVLEEPVEVEVEGEV
jgi:hypothetical protein